MIDVKEAAWHPHSLSDYRMAASYLVRFLSLLGSKQTTKSEWSVTFKCALTFRTVGSCPAVFTNTETCHMVAMPAVFTGAVQLAAEPKVPKWADWLKENKIHHHVGVINRYGKSWGKQTSKTRNMQQSLKCVTQKQGRCLVLNRVLMIH